MTLPGDDGAQQSKDNSVQTCVTAKKWRLASGEYASTSPSGISTNAYQSMLTLLLTAGMLSSPVAETGKSPASQPRSRPQRLEPVRQAPQAPPCD